MLNYNKTYLMSLFLSYKYIYTRIIIKRSLYKDVFVKVVIQFNIKAIL